MNFEEGSRFDWLLNARCYQTLYIFIFGTTISLILEAMYSEF